MKIIVPPDNDHMVRVRHSTYLRLVALSEKYRAYCKAHPEVYPASMTTRLSISDTIDMLINSVPQGDANVE